ncbi:flagellar biosynthesis protein FlhB [Nitratiruptor sp. SB155-2]|uniref:flagellar biosynthesis protein FlhB n=1 Tax=Nitratiruptor sp. (strain SB155-2) TaxID=387092 RepID=UPI0001586DEA|nr:flagellar biosynthesis protein FlhB [Nitratiruptor sp. SB155-2]BAF69749.1 flagellar biosynthetic protein FlhB [Nitratiruptor sp. SB155-2]
MAKDPSKTEKATPRRREKAREEGQVAKSQDIPISATLIVVFMLFLAYIPFAYKKLYELFMFIFADPLYNIPQYNYSIIYLVMEFMGYLTIPFFLALLITGVVSNIAQIGFLLTFKSMVPKLEKIDPIAGLKRLFSLKTLFELVKNILKLIAATIVSYFLVQFLLRDVFQYATTTPYKDAVLLVKYTLIMILGFAILSIPIAAIDFFFRKFEFEENIKMSKHEVKEEHKQMEGNPQVKSEIRKRMREMSMNRIMAEVPKADVVITNPVHFAVALKYEKEKMHAPKVVAKGKDYLALKIKEIAKEHGVPIEENPPLARAIYQACDVDEYIPENLYKAIAKIFAKVFKRQRRRL